MKKKVWRYDLCTHVYQKWQSYDVWFLRYGAWQTEFFVILGHFLPFYLPNDPENQNFEMKKNLGDIIILNICTINDNHMVYGSWDMEHKKIFCFGPFLTFYPTNNPKNQNFDKTKKKNTPGNIINLHKCTKNHDHMLYCSWDMARDGFNFYFSFMAIFCPFTPLKNSKNQNFNQMKKRLEISSFYTSVSNNYYHVI